MDILALIPQSGGIAFTVLAFVLALSIIVAVHEYGHYIVGRWSGIHAEVFSVGFGRVLWSRVDKRGTRWQIAALPFGGYVRFLGDANAASGKDAEVMARARQEPATLRRTMHGAPLWARSATVAAGPAFNFMMSILVFTLIFLSQGDVRDPLTVGNLRSLPGGTYDLRPGDEVLSIGGLAAPSFDDHDAWRTFSRDIPREQVLPYGIRRDGQEMTVDGPFLFPARIAQVTPRSAAHDIGLEAGDVIIGVDGERVFAFDQLKAIVEGSNGRPLLLDVVRDGEVLEFALTPRRTDEPQDGGGFRTHWRIGIVSGMAFEPATVAAGPGQALGNAMRQTWRIVNSSVSGLWHMITGRISTCNISGPLGIAETSGAMASQGAESFIWFIAGLSTAVGLLNLFPIPALDGGHLVFYAYEAAVGRPPGNRALRILMLAGIAVIVTLMIFALGNDLFCP